MKPTKHILLLAALLLGSLAASAQDFEVDGIYYNITSEVDMTAEVTGGGGYSIPATVTYKGVTYSVTSIGEGAFLDCSSLTSIVIPEGVTSIGVAAFAYCESLTSITIPESVTSIGDDAFGGCSGLTSVTIPGGVTSIGIGAFSYCSNLNTIIVAEGNTKYDSRDWCNAIIETNSNTLITGCSTTVIPESVTSIGDDAFGGCSGLTTVTLPESVTSIGNWAFWGCNSLTSITIPGGVMSIGRSAFSGCSSLTSITIPDGVTSIGDDAFYACSSLTSITCKAITPPTIESATFGNVDKSIPVYVPAGSVNAYKSAEYWSEFTNIQPIPSTDIASGTCGDNLTWRLTEEGELIIEGTGEMYDYTHNYGTQAPWEEYRSSIKEVTIFEGVTSISGEAFEYCSNLTVITIPESVTSIGYGAFSGCTGLTSIVVLAGNSVYDSRGGCNAIIETSSNTLITGCSATVIPEGVTSIGGYAFCDCSSLTTITLPESVTSIGSNAFYSCTSLTTITVPSSVMSIGYMAFFGCSSLTSVNSLENVTHIGERAFCACNLTRITIPAGMTSIEKGAFANNPNLIEIVVEQGNAYYDSRNNCNAIIETSKGLLVAGCSSTVIPEGVSTIGYCAFSHCSNLTAITIPESVTCIGDFAFSDCSSLAEITCEAVNPPRVGEGYPTSPFMGVSRSTPIYVPAGSVEAYRSAEYWNEFTNIQPLFNEYALTVSAAGYATLYLDYAVAIPEEVEVYIASKVEDDRLMMTEVEGVLPANIGVIVRAKAGTYTFVESEETPADVEGNLLTGTTTDTYITAASGYRYYVLAQKDGAVGMYRPKLTDGQFLNNANKAYLALDPGNLGIFDDEVDTGEEGGQLSNRLRFDFGGTTSIQNSQFTIQNSQFIYDLHGRRVENPTKGIYIVNGRKVVVK